VSSWAAVVLNWNGLEDTVRCVDALRPQADLIVVADNGSAEVPRLPGVELVENGTNLGFSGGCNRAIERALELGADWVVLVNNDATVEPGCFDALRAAAGHRVLTGVLLNEDGSVQWAGQRLSLRTGYSGRPSLERPTVDRPVPRAVGALMAVPRQAIEAVGAFDEGLFAYVEDVEWCVRLARAGWPTVLVADARARHGLSKSTGGHGSTATLYYGARNTVVVCERLAPRGHARTGLRRAVIAATFAVRAARVSGPAGMRAVLEGLNDARRGRLGRRPGSP
jgi:GT2 family glycosyltransferase